MAVVARAHRDEVWLVSLDPTVGVKIENTRPCLIISPDEMNESLRTVIVAPMTTTLRHYPTRIAVQFQGKRGEVALDQLRAVDQKRLIQKLGSISASASQRIAAILDEMFSRS